ncbi:hypothetical protein FJR09_04430 [Dolichospermum sp. UHCC 0406]|nr:hypothetical protein [Dolichospermum sp. UHCC 0299]MTJ38104.1 hypothetical protein [Dolichospermum sp. UHCC 0406]
MLTVTIDEIQKNFTSYLHQVAAGESIIIIEAGKAIAEIKPVPNIMEKLDYPELVQQVLATHTDGHCSEGTEIELIFDIQRNRYLVIHIGWEGENRTYGTMIHVDIKDGKIWIQRDLTEEGVANELVELGVPKSDIVLAFRAPHIRQFTDFAQD